MIEGDKFLGRFVSNVKIVSEDETAILDSVDATECGELWVAETSVRRVASCGIAFGTEG